MWEKMNRELNIPETLCNSLFFGEENSVALDMDACKIFAIHNMRSFSYELAASVSDETYRPWEKASDVLPSVFEAWRTDLQPELDKLYAMRNSKGAAPFMLEAISYCFSTLFWLNGRPVQLNDWEGIVGELDYCPVNFGERMSFILKRPALFQSFKTIEQLMAELEKLAAKKKVREQLKQRKKG